MQYVLFLFFKKAQNPVVGGAVASFNKSSADLD